MNTMPGAGDTAVKRTDANLGLHGIHNQKLQKECITHDSLISITAPVTLFCPNFFDLHDSNSKLSFEGSDNALLILITSAKNMFLFD